MAKANSMTRKGLYVAIGLVITAAIAVSVARFELVRHVIYNNTGSQFYAIQEHHGSKIAPGDAGNVNGLFDAPLMNRFTFGGLENGQTGVNAIRFSSDKVIEILDRRDGNRRSADLPSSYSSGWLLGRQLSYQLEPDGKLYLLGSGASPPVKTMDSQPAGFPISLFVEREPNWADLHLEGATLELIDDRILEQYKFAGGGYALTSIGQKGGAVAPPVFYWRIENGSLILSEDTQGKAFAELASPRLLGHVLTVVRKPGGTTKYLLSRPGR